MGLLFRVTVGVLGLRVKLLWFRLGLLVRVTGCG